MRIPAINTIKNTLGAVLVGGTVLFTPIYSKAKPQQDKFEYVTPKVPPQGTTDLNVLKSAPSPKVVIKGDTINAAIVVDVSKNVLYHTTNTETLLKHFQLQQVNQAPQHIQE